MCLIYALLCVFCESTLWMLHYTASSLPFIVIQLMQIASESGNNSIKEITHTRRGEQTSILYIKDPESKRFYTGN